MFILFGAGIIGRMALDDYGKEQVAFFCDNYCNISKVKGIQVIKFEKLKEIYKDYDVIITPWNTDARNEICRQLEQNNIPYTIYKPKENKNIPRNLLHIHGVCPALNYEMGDTYYSLPRVYQTIEMFRKMFNIYQKDFENYYIDINVYLLDEVDEAYEIAKKNHLNYIFAYCTLYSVSDTVIPIPDFKSFIDEKEYFYEEDLAKCKKAAEMRWKDPRICWRGNVKTNISRKQLLYMSERFPEYFSFETVEKGKEGKYMSMTEQAQYKYLIDVRGYSWTDRVKVLFHLGRPIFLVDRPYKEWYFDTLVPWKHYIPIKEDLSDLVENYEYMENHPEKYEEIRNNMLKFAEKYLSPEAVMNYLKNICLKYGAKEKTEKENDTI